LSIPGGGTSCDPSPNSAAALSTITFVFIFVVAFILGPDLQRGTSWQTQAGGTVKA